VDFGGRRTILLAARESIAKLDKRWRGNQGFDHLGARGAEVCGVGGNALRRAFVAIAVAIGSQVCAQESAPAPTPTPGEPAIAAICCVIPEGAVVELEVTQTVSTKTSVRGDKFGLRLVQPIVVEGKVLAPAGLTGVGEVVHAAKAGMAGKAAELIVTARYLDDDGVAIPLRGLNIATHSKSLSDEATAAVIAVGVIGLLVKADEAAVPAGTRATAKVATAVTVTPPKSDGAPTSEATPPSSPTTESPLQ